MTMLIWIKKIKYQTVQDACELLEENAYMAKIDLISAYRNVALHPWQYELMIYNGR